MVSSTWGLRATQGVLGAGSTPSGHSQRPRCGSETVLRSPGLHGGRAGLLGAAFHCRGSGRRGPDPAAPDAAQPGRPAPISLGTVSWVLVTRVLIQNPDCGAGL